MNGPRKVFEPTDLAGQATDRSEVAAGVAGPPLVTIVIPTKEEAANIVPLLARLNHVASKLSVEVVFVDDSDDETPEAIRAAAGDICAPVSVLHREPDERAGGLATAVVAGMARARGTWVCVLDADLQHPPELILDLVERAQNGDVDLVVASRFVEGGHADEFGALRTLLSRGSSGLARVGFRRALRGVTDPMSGFFLVRVPAVDLGRLRPHGFKILLELLVRAPNMRKAEVPFVFGERNAGHSKASMGEAANYMLHLWRLRLTGGAFRFARFGMVGLSGLVVNTLLLAALAEGTHMYYVLAAIVATQGSTLWNFALTEWWVFKAGGPASSRLKRLLKFALVNNFALGLRGPLLILFTDAFRVNYLVSNVLSLFALTMLRFGIADSWIWAPAKRAATRRLYDIHGIISVASDVKLPELERFSVPELATEPTIDVKIAPVISRAGRGKTVEISHDRFTYDEGLGTRGFLEALAALAARALHERRGAGSPLELRGARLRARPRGMHGKWRQGLLDHRTHRHWKDDDDPQVPRRESQPRLSLRRPNSALPRRQGAHLPEALDDQQAHGVRSEGTTPESQRTGCTRLPKPAALEVGKIVRVPSLQIQPARCDDQHDRATARAAAEVSRRSSRARRVAGAGSKLRRARSHPAWRRRTTAAHPSRSR